MEIFDCKKIFSFRVNEEVEDKMLITFNILKSQKDSKLTEYKAKYKNTLELHRNQNTNTIYTINSLNKMLKESIDRQIDWTMFENSVMLIDRETGLSRLPIKLLKVFDVSDYDGFGKTTRGIKYEY